MNVQMIDRLPTVVARVYDQPEAILQLVHFHKFVRCLEQLAERCGILKLGDISHMLTGNDQSVSWSLWVDVVKRDILFILQGKFARDLLIDDFAEDAVGISLHL
jgi:hypothetical protein